MLRSSFCVSLFVLWYGICAPAVLAETWSFEGNQVGICPDGWEQAKTGEGPGCIWQVVADASASDGVHALAQMSSDGPRPVFNLCIVEDSAFQDPEISVSVKPLSGVVDQGGGPVWRYVDANNYYVARLNPLETNFRVYKVIDGVRTQLQSAEVDEPAGEWHTLRIEQRDNHIRGYLNGKLLLEVTDNSLADAGRIGLWTKADAVTLFDNLTVDEAK